MTYEDCNRVARISPSNLTKVEILLEQKLRGHPVFAHENISDSQS